MKKKLAVFLIIFSLVTTFVQSSERKILFVDGSNIYIKIFLFFFPIGRSYDCYFVRNDDRINAELEITRENIINEPISEQEKGKIFETDLLISIKDIPKGKTGEYDLPVMIRCNRKVTKTLVHFTVVTSENIMVIKGNTNLLLGDITDNPSYKKRYKWKYPFYFDLRMQVPELPAKKGVLDLPDN